MQINHPPPGGREKYKLPSEILWFDYKSITINTKYIENILLSGLLKPHGLGFTNVSLSHPWAPNPQPHHLLPPSSGGTYIKSIQCVKPIKSKKSFKPNNQNKAKLEQNTAKKKQTKENFRKCSKFKKCWHNKAN
jgi:hypothetical protein